MDIEPFHALNRFGLGRRGTEALPADPKAWLQSQLQGDDAGPPGPSLADGFAAWQQDQAARRARRLADASPPGAAAPAPPPPGAFGAGRMLAKGEIDALVGYAVATPAPFRERLVRFWANHFTVAMRGPIVAVTAGDFVRTAIRPHVTGRFHDMLLAVMRHPAMLAYLDNARSVGPNSTAGLKSGRGLNENLARESLELHTISPAAGYSQADVTTYASILTGWSVSMGRDQPAGFVFRPELHEPGAKTLMGRTFPEGEEGGLAALAWLAEHPATHRHLAAKLVEHFVADTASPADVAVVEAVLRDTRGDLGLAAAAVVSLPSAWQPMTKLRAPQDYVLAALRAADLPEDRRPDGAAVMRTLGQPMFGAPFPIGWPDRAADWSGPESVMRRVDWAFDFSNRAQMDPVTIADASLGPLLTAQTVAAMRGAGSRQDALTLLFTSPEFQRR